VPLSGHRQSPADAQPVAMGHRQEHTRQRTTAPHAASPDHPGESRCPCRLRGGVGAQPPPQCPLSLHVVGCLLGSLHLVAHCLLHCRQFACLLYSALACFSLECVLCVCREFVVVSFLQQFYLSLHLVGLKLDPWHMCVPCGPCHRFCPHFVEFRVFLQPQPRVRFHNAVVYTFCSGHRQRWIAVWIPG
jgi:hypothetical protein